MVCGRHCRTLWLCRRVVFHWSWFWICVAHMNLFNCLFVFCYLIGGDFEGRDCGVWLDAAFPRILFFQHSCLHREVLWSSSLFVGWLVCCSCSAFLEKFTSRFSRNVERMFTICGKFYCNLQIQGQKHCADNIPAIIACDIFTELSSPTDTWLLIVQGDTIGRERF